MQTFTPKSIQERLNDNKEAFIASLENGTNALLKEHDFSNPAAYPYDINGGVIFSHPLQVLSLLSSGHEDKGWLSVNTMKNQGIYAKKGSKGVPIMSLKSSFSVYETEADGTPILDQTGNALYQKIDFSKNEIKFNSFFNKEDINYNNDLNNTIHFASKRANIKDWDLILSGADVKYEFGNEGSKNVYAKQGILFVPSIEAFTKLSPEDYRNGLLDDEQKIDFEKGAKQFYANTIGELSRVALEKKAGDMLPKPGEEAYKGVQLQLELARFLTSAKLGLDFKPNQSLDLANNRFEMVKYLKANEKAFDKARTYALNIHKDVLRPLSQENTLDYQVSKQLNEASSMEERIAQEDTFINVPFKQKELAKALGAKWNIGEKSWYVEQGDDLNKFERWEYVRTLDSSTYNSVEEEFKAAALNKGLIIDQVQATGTLIRVPVEGDGPKMKSGAYVLHLDGHPAGFIQNFKTGFKANWKSELEVDFTKQRIDASDAKARFEAKEQQKEIAHEQTSKRTIKEIAEIKESGRTLYYEKDGELKAGNPYLLRKDFEAGESFGALIDKKGNIALPLQDINGKIWAMQRILSDGRKFITVNKTAKERQENTPILSKKKGNFFVIGDNNFAKADKLMVCEGFATGATLHKAAQQQIPVVVALDAGNLPIVVKNIKEKFKDMKLLVALDDDQAKGNTNGNPGLQAGEVVKNMQLEGITFRVPKFNQDEIASGFSDFNDLMTSRGLEAVKNTLKIAARKTQSLDKELSHEKEVLTKENKDNAKKKEVSTKKEVKKAKERKIESDLGMSM